MFLEISKAIILGVIEGITEFLPISSTGHLILVNNWLRFSPSFTVLFDVVIQLGAIMAVVLVFWRKLWPFGKDAAQYMATRILWYKIIIAVLPALVLGALFGGMIEEKLFNPITVAVALMVGGFVLIFFEKKDKNVSELSDINIVSYRNAFLIGVFQCLAMVPGTSRSAVTIISAMLLGVGRVAAVEFSFFLAIPTMVAASGYSLLQHGFSLNQTELVVLIVGFVTAFLSALVGVTYFVRYIQTHNFKSFGYYRLVLGAVVLTLFFFSIIN